jgi:hypothetical protein
VTEDKRNILHVRINQESEELDATINTSRALSAEEQRGRISGSAEKICLFFEGGQEWKEQRGETGKQGILAETDKG